MLDGTSFRNSLSLDGHRLTDMRLIPEPIRAARISSSDQEPAEASRRPRQDRFFVHGEFHTTTLSLAPGHMNGWTRQDHGWKRQSDLKSLTGLLPDTIDQSTEMPVEDGDGSSVGRGGRSSSSRELRRHGGAAPRSRVCRPNSMTIRFAALAANQGEKFGLGLPHPLGHDQRIAFVGVVARTHTHVLVAE